MRLGGGGGSVAACGNSRDPPVATESQQERHQQPLVYPRVESSRVIPVQFLSLPKSTHIHPSHSPFVMAPVVFTLPASGSSPFHSLPHKYCGPTGSPSTRAPGHPNRDFRAKSRCKEEGQAFPGPQCTAVVRCAKGYYSVKHCTGGLVWNNEQGSCDLPSRVPKCSTVVLTPKYEGSCHGPPSTPPPPSPPEKATS